MCDTRLDMQHIPNASMTLGVTGLRTCLESVSADSRQGASISTRRPPVTALAHLVARKASKCRIPDCPGVACLCARRACCMAC